MKVMAIPDYCMGCGLCEVYCAAKHDGFKGNVLKAFKKGRAVSRSRLIEADSSFWLNTCMHCEDAPCINACISGAMSKDKDGIVRVDEEKCVGCYTCIMVCPFGHIQIHPLKSTVIKCDLCRGEADIPACVAHCPNEALIIVES